MTMIVQGKGGEMIFTAEGIMQPRLSDTIELQLRGNRMAWQTADGRFNFVRYKDGWAITAATAAWNGATTASNTDDRQLLVDSMLVSEKQYNPLAVFSSLREAREVLVKVTSMLDNPPVTKIRQRPVAYLTTGVEAKIYRSPDLAAGWRIETSSAFSVSLVVALRGRYGGMNIISASRISAIMRQVGCTSMHLRGGSYPTRAAALATIISRVRAVEEEIAHG